MPSSAVRTIDTLLARVIVPGWIMAGAVFKLAERTPGNLPSQIVKAGKDFGGAAGLDTNLVLHVLLRSLIGLEFLAAGVMFFLPRLARPMAIFMTACFCAILANEIRHGAATCGCFGKLPISPVTMLVIDGSLLVGLIVFGLLSRREAVMDEVRPTAPRRSAWPVVAALFWTSVGFGVSFGLPDRAPTLVVVADTSQPDPPLPEPEPGPKPPEPTPPQPTPPGPQPIPAPEPGPPVVPPGPPADPTINPSPQHPATDWYSTSVEQWKDKPWREIELFQFMPKWPKDLDKGRRYVVFYRKDCDRCHELLDNHFFGKPTTPTVLIAIPPNPGDPQPAALPMPTKIAEFMELPRGTKWLITPPLLVAIENGVVICATEGENADQPACLVWP